MTTQTGRPVGPATIERRRAKTTAEIAALGLPLPGSLVERRTAAATPAAAATPTHHSCTGPT